MTGGSAGHKSPQTVTSVPQLPADRQLPPFTVAAARTDHHKLCSCILHNVNPNQRAVHTFTAWSTLGAGSLLGGPLCCLASSLPLSFSCLLSAFSTQTAKRFTWEHAVLSGRSGRRLPPFFWCRSSIWPESNSTAVFSVRKESKLNI